MLKEEQRFVGGRIERLRFTEELDLIYNEKGKLIGLLPMVTWVEEGKLLEVIALCEDIHRREVLPLSKKVILQSFRRS